MKCNIHGFHQPKAVELGLTNDDLLVLRWFVDFAGTKKMKTIIEEDGIYYWVNYTTVLEDLPVLRISKTTLKRKHFDSLCNSNILKHKHIKEGGSFSYYAYGINYDTLVYLQNNDPSTKLDYPSTKLDKGYDEIGQGVLQNSTNKDYSINNYSISNINNIYSPAKAEQNIPYLEIIEYLNTKTNSNYKETTRKTKDLIKARFNEGFSLEDFKKVIDNKSNEWLNTDMQKYLRPETLFGTKFESYLNQKYNNEEINPSWYGKNIKKKEMSKEEQEELEKLLSEFKGD